MFTRCPGCSTVHPINAALLARHGGKYRCGKCDKVSNALDSLFDEWPKAGQGAVQAGDIPVLGLEIDLDQARRSRLGLGEEADSRQDAPAAHRPSRHSRLWLRSAWVAGGLVVGLVIILNTASFTGQPVFTKKEMDHALVRLGLKTPEPVDVSRDLDRIHLVSRELKNDPDRPGILKLNLTLVNRSVQPQPYPVIEVILKDAEGNPVTARRYQAREYLQIPRGDVPLFSPQAYLPLNLEFRDPGERAVGFELKFQ